MIPSNIKSEHIMKAIREIDLKGIFPGRESQKYNLTFEGKQYPPKYVLSLANRFANGKELDPYEFKGGKETNNILRNLGFDVVEISSIDISVKPVSSQNKIFQATQKGHEKKYPERTKSPQDDLISIAKKIESKLSELATDYQLFKNVKKYISPIIKIDTLTELRLVPNKLQSQFHVFWNGRNDIVHPTKYPFTDEQIDRLIDLGIKILDLLSQENQ